MFQGRHRLRAGALAGCFLLMVSAGAAPSPAWAQETPAASPSPEEARLMGQMLDAKTPEEKLDLSKQILKLNPNNQTALKFRDEALQELDNKQKEAQKRQQDKLEAQKKQVEGRKALEQGENALANGNVQEASRFLTIAKQAGMSGVLINTLDRNINARNRMRTEMQYLLMGSATVVVGALAGALLWFKRKKVLYLELTEGSRKGTRYRIEREITNIGAVEEFGDTRNDVAIADRLGAISRLHCQIRIKNGKPYLVDCNSSNGTFVNGQRVPPRRLVPLKSGAEIDLAHSSKMRVGFERKKT